jgi:IS5 family transposase
MYFLSLRFNLSDVATEEAIYDRLSFQYFMNIDVTVDQIPDATTLNDFRQFLEANEL